MRISFALICLIVFSTGVLAVEPVDDQQVMLYYIIPLDADRQDNNKHQFGLRFDRTTHNPGDEIQINALEKRPAALDFRMGYKGVQSLKIHGVDYASYLIARAAEGEEAPVETTTGGPEATSDTAAGESETAPEAPAAGDEAGTPAGTEEQQQEKPIVQQKIDALPFGVVMGVVLGVVILVGAGS